LYSVMPSCSGEMEAIAASSATARIILLRSRW